MIIADNSKKLCFIACTQNVIKSGQCSCINLVNANLGNDFIQRVSGSTLNEKCTADGCNEPAIADYNGHGDFGCKYHLKKWEKEFDDDYR